MVQSQSNLSLPERAGILRTKDFLALSDGDGLWYISPARAHKPHDAAGSWLASHAADGLRRQFYHHAKRRLEACGEDEAWALLVDVQKSFCGLVEREQDKPCLSPWTRHSL